jgi:hypothetical protein
MMTFAAFRFLCLVTLSWAVPGASSEESSPSVFVGTWQGSSTCVNRQLAPACRDETVVYDVRISDTAGAVILKADKIVDGKRVPMGELEFTYSSPERCWRSEFETPRVHAAWCLVVKGNELTGRLRLLPGNEIVRDVRLQRR